MKHKLQKDLLTGSISSFLRSLHCFIILGCNMIIKVLKLDFKMQFLESSVNICINLSKQPLYYTYMPN